MSRHHMHLPPITYTPPPKPKKVEKRRRRGQIQPDGSIKDTEDASEIEHAIGLGQPPAPSAHKPPPGGFSPVDASARRREEPEGLLSQGTLKEMLLVQEKSG